MPIEREIPKTHPLHQSWEAWRASDEYANTRRWALTEGHVDGSLWAAFRDGYLAASAELLPVLEDADTTINPPDTS